MSFLGIDLGGTNIKSVVLTEDDSGYSVTGFRSEETQAERGPTHVIDRIVSQAKSVAEDHGPFVRVGLGLPGVFDDAAGTVELFPNLPGPWRGQPIRDPVAQGLGSDVVLINDARAFSLAESNLGAGRGCHTVVCLTLGTGVGGGVVIDGRLHLGAWGGAGEIGHQTVQPDGPVCGCGNHGCVEALARADVLVRLAGKGDAAEVYATAEQGDEASRRAIATTSRWLGIGLANAVTVLGPDRIVIGGGIVAAGDLVLDPIRTAIKERVTLVPVDEIDVVAAELGGTAGAIGAALYAAQTEG